MDKKWLIGCGGCLGVILIGALLLGGLTFIGIDSVVKGTQEASNSTLGEAEAENYDTMAMGPLLMMRHRSGSHILLISNEDISEARLEDLKSGRYDTLKQFVSNYLIGANMSADAKITESMALPLEAGEQMAHKTIYFYPAKNMSVPALLTFLVKENKKVQTVIYMDERIKKKGSDVGFSAEFDDFSLKLAAIIDSSKLAEELILIPFDPSFEYE